MKRFSNYLLQLYRGALEKPTDEFKAWALNETKALIPFDACIWGAASWIDGRLKINSAHLHNLEAGFIPNWMKHQHEDKLINATNLHVDQTINFDTSTEYAGTAILQFHYQPFSTAHILSTTNLDTDTRLLNTLSLYRANPSLPFSEVERALKEVIFPHLIEALRKNWVANLPLLFPGNQRSTYNSIASCDAFGVLQVSLPTFIETCRNEWPAWHGPTLPQALRSSIEKGELKFTGEKIVVNLSKLDDVVLLRMRPKLAADELSPRELEVAQRFSSGEDYKTIAQKLSLSPSTIKGHLNKIYLKLDINEKASLVAEIRRMTY